MDIPLCTPCGPPQLLDGIFFCAFLGTFSLGNKKQKSLPPKNPQLNSNQRLGVSRPNFTLHGSALERLQMKLLKEEEEAGFGQVVHVFVFAKPKTEEREYT